MHDRVALILFAFAVLLAVLYLFDSTDVVSVLSQFFNHDLFHSHAKIKLYAHNHQSQLNQSSSNQSSRFEYYYTHTSADFKYNHSSSSSPAPGLRGGGVGKVQPHAPSSNHQPSLNHHQSNHYQSNQSVSSNQSLNSNSYEYNNTINADYDKLLSALFSLPAPAPSPQGGGELVWITNNNTLQEQSELVEIELDNLFEQQHSGQPGFVSRLNQYIVQTNECYNTVLTYSLISRNTVSFYADNSEFMNMNLDAQILASEVVVAQSDKISQSQQFVYKITFIKDNKLFVLLNYNNKFSKTFQTNVIYTENSKTLVLTKSRVYALVGDYIIMYNTQTHEVKTFRLFKPHKQLYIVHAYLMREQDSIILIVQFNNNVYYIKLNADLNRVLAFHVFRNTELIFSEYLIKSDICNQLSSYYILIVLEQDGHFYTLIINQNTDKVIKLLNNAYSSAEVLDNKIVLMHLLLFSSSKYYLIIASYQSTTLEMNLYFYAFDKESGAFILASGGWTPHRAYNQLLNYFTLLNISFNQLFTITQA